VKAVHSIHAHILSLQYFLCTLSRLIFVTCQISIVTMVAACTSEMSVNFYWTVQYDIGNSSTPQDCSFFCFPPVINQFHVGWVPCHHGMAHPRVADGGDSLQIWRVAVNILNKQLQTADKGWSSSLGLGVCLTTSHHKKYASYERSQEALDLNRFFG
jgi:hypothetical protein